MWRKSSFSSDTANCVEVWQQSTKCTGGDCLQVAYHKSTLSDANGGSCVEVAGCTCNEVRVRDSKDKTGPVLVFTGDEWGVFVAGVKAGEFDR